jgi:hypothetical protein
MEGAAEKVGASEAEGADESVGASERVGLSLGDEVGTLDGLSEASNTVGCIEILGATDWVGPVDADGSADRASDGLVEMDACIDGVVLGNSEGFSEGSNVGFAAGLSEGWWEGTAWVSVGLAEGRGEVGIVWFAVGLGEGWWEGGIVWVAVGLVEGWWDGGIVCVPVGPADGRTEGFIVWPAVGLSDGWGVCIVWPELGIADGVDDGESVPVATGLELGIEDGVFTPGVTLGLAEGNVGTEGDVEGRIDGDFVASGSLGGFVKFDVGTIDGDFESDGDADIVGDDDGIWLVVGEFAIGAGVGPLVGEPFEDFEDFESEGEEADFFDFLGILLLLIFDFFSFRARRLCELLFSSFDALSIPLLFRSKVFDFWAGLSFGYISDWHRIEKKISIKIDARNDRRLRHRCVLDLIASWWIEVFH